MGSRPPGLRCSRVPLWQGLLRLCRCAALLLQTARCVLRIGRWDRLYSLGCCLARWCRLPALARHPHESGNKGHRRCRWLLWLLASTDGLRRLSGQSYILDNVVYGSFPWGVVFDGFSPDNAAVLFLFSRHLRFCGVPCCVTRGCGFVFYMYICTVFLLGHPSSTV